MYIEPKTSQRDASLLSARGGGGGGRPGWPGFAAVFDDAYTITRSGNGVRHIVGPGLVSGGYSTTFKSTRYIGNTRCKGCTTARSVINIAPTVYNEFHDPFIKLPELCFIAYSLQPRFPMFPLTIIAPPQVPLLVNASGDVSAPVPVNVENCVECVCPFIGRRVELDHEGWCKILFSAIESEPRPGCLWNAEGVENPFSLAATQAPRVRRHEWL
jgi:hypothetical protein